MKKRFLIVTGLLALCFSNVKVNSINISNQKKANISISDCEIVDIAAGSNHNLALDSDGNLWAWGSNSSGQLGDGTTTDSNVPIQIMRGHKFKKISAGRDCSAAIDENGYLYGWGSSANPTSSKVYAPTLVSDSITYIDVNCNYSGTNTTESSSDKFYFGYSNNIRTASLLKNNIIYFLYVSATIDTGDNFYSIDGYNYKVDNGPSVNQIFLITQYGKIEYYTKNNPDNSYSFFGEIILDGLKDIPMKYVSLRKINEIASSPSSSPYYGTVFFVSQEGNIYSLGYNGTNNYLGSNETIGQASSLTPIKVDSSAKFTKVSAGQSHVLALDEDGKVYSWGNNGYGQLGTGDYDQLNIPTKIRTLNETRSISFISFINEEFTSSFSQYHATSYNLVTAPSKGNLVINSGTGEFTYTPNLDEYGNDTAVISMEFDGVVVEYQVNIYIDRKPVFTGGSPSINLECGESLTVSMPSTDPDGDDITYSIKQEPSKGFLALNLNTRSYTYTAREDVAGSDSFTLSISDGYCSVDYPVTVHINSLITSSDDTEITIDLETTDQYSSNVNAADIDGDTLSYTVLTNAGKGNVVIDSLGNYTYTASGDFYGDDSFTIRIDDGYKPLDITYNVHLYSLLDNGTSLLNKITAGTTYNGQIKTIVNGTSVLYSISTQTSNGFVSIDENTGEYTYVPNVGSIGDDSFQVLVESEYESYILTIHIYQNSIPDNTSVTTSFSTNQNTNYNGSAQCLDLDGDILRYSINRNPLKGSLSINEFTGEYIYYPNTDVVGNDSFEIKIYDGVDTIYQEVLVHIESKINMVSSVNEIISQNSSLSSQIIADDLDGDSLVYSIESTPSNGVANIDSFTGDYTYIPSLNFYGNDSFVIKVDDGVEPVFSTINVLVNRKPIADKIVINLSTNGVTATGTATCSDPDGDILTYSISQEAQQGTVFVNSSTGMFAYTPNVNAHGDDHFIIKASDGSDDILVTVNVHNETSVELDNQATTIVVSQGKNTNGQVLAIDRDGDELTYSIKTYPTKGNVNLNANTGSWTYYSLSNATGIDLFEIEVTDGNSSITMTYNLLINTPASFESNVYSFETNQNTTYIGNVLAIDSNGDALTYSIVSQGDKGTATIDSETGRYQYSPNIDAAGNDSFVVGVSDGYFTTEVEVNVHIESDIVIEQGFINTCVNKNEICTGKVQASDLDGDTLIYSIYKQGEKGIANVLSDGSYSYHANNGAGDDSFIVSITDGIHTSFVIVYVHISTNPVFEDSVLNITVAQNNVTTGQVNGYDEDGDSLKYFIVTEPTNGSISLNSITGEYIYKPNSNITTNTDSLVIGVTDENSTSTITVNIIINEKPEVQDTIIELKQGGNISGSIKAVDKENDPITYTIVSNGTHGTASINSATGIFTYVCNDNIYNGKDTFTIEVSDGYNTTTIVVSVNITKNKAPFAKGGSINTSSGENVSGKVNGNDYEGDNLVYSISSQGVKGTVYINEETGEFIYTANKDTEGKDYFLVSITDGYNTVSYLYEVNIEYVDSNNSWAIPTTIVTGTGFAGSLSTLLIFILKKKKFN